MQTLRKKTSPCKYKNDPSRFLGEGVSFKAKLIGILEVSEARGDRMCQEALADLKMAIRAAGEHKQRININIAIDGLRLRDEKTADCLYHHPVHKISFIAQDMSDSRAFGYIFGSPDTGHRFFGIKTDKAASQVVIAMRDLFQVVFELKKKEIEMAKQHIEQHQLKAPDQLDSSAGPKGEQAFRKMKTIQEDSVRESDKPAQQTSEVIADLLDLEFELNSIQQGIHQMERITPSDPFGPSAAGGGGDPFGDSFAPAAPSPSPPRPVAVLPPPPRAARHDKPSPGPPTQEKHWFDKETEALFDDADLKSPTAAPIPALPATVDKVAGQSSSISPPKQPQPSSHIDVFMELDPLGTGRNKPYVDRKDFFQELKNPPKKVLKDLVTEAPNEATAPLFKASFDMKSPASIQTYRSFPSEGVLSPASNAVSSSVLQASTAVIKPSKSEVDPFPTSTTFKGDPFEDDSFVSICSVTTSVSSSDPFNTDFADFTMFASESTSKTVVEEADAEKKPQSFLQGPEAISSKANFHGPLRVSLPPEKENIEATVAALTGLKSVIGPAKSSSVSISRIRSRTSKFQKQMTTSDIIRLPSPKTQKMLADITRQKSFDVCSGTTAASRLTSSPTPPRITPLAGPVERLSPPHAESESKIISSFPSRVASFPESPDIDISSTLQMSRIDHTEIAPEPPPRPTTNIMPIKPPPLPPKRQQACEVVKPPPRPPHVDEHSGYDYIDDYKTSSVLRDLEDMNKMPLSMRMGTLQFDEFDKGISIPRRPKKESSVASNDYVPSFPTLPQTLKKFSPIGSDKISVAAVTTIESFLQTSASSAMYSSYENLQKNAQLQKASLDITLSELTKTGLTDLAQTLGVSKDHLSKMTLQDFTEHLSKLTALSQSVEESSEDEKSEIQNIKREKYLTLRESVDKEPVFKAEFEDHFDNSDVNEKFEDVFENPSFDKYAVFRELIEQESKEEISTQPDSNKNTLLDLEENLEDKSSEAPEENSEYSQQNQDRYAALRQICTIADQAETDVISPSREKEEIQAEASMHTSSQQDDVGAFDTTAVREPISIIETTIEEEDITAIESEDAKSPEKLSVTIKHGVSIDKITSPGTKYEHQIIQTDIADIITSDQEIKKISEETVATSEEETKSPVAGWAKFDMKPLRFERPHHEASNEEAVSPWSSDGKELIKIPPLWQEDFPMKADKIHKYKQRSSPWKEEDSEEFWEDVPQHQHENGWSDSESFYDEMVQVKERRARRKKSSPWKDRKVCRDMSPLERNKRAEEAQHWKGMWKRCQEHSMDEEEDEEFEYNRSRARHRGLSWDNERRRRHGSAEYEGDEYEYGPKQRPSPWRAERDRRGSWESGSWDEEDRFSQREYGDRWPRNEEEDEYRRRCEQDNESRCYGRSRKYSGGSEGDYGHHEYMGRRRHRNYRDRSRESPWEDDYSEHDREDPLRYRSKKRNWPVRPNSASETRRTADKPSPGDYKSRQVPCSGKAEMSDKSFASEWRYREKGARPRSRESYFTSDQEYEFWPSHKTDKMHGHDQRSQTLQMRRNRRYRRPPEYGYSQKSPFDDDFSLHSFEIPDINAKESCDASDKSVKSSEEPIHDSITTPTQDSSKVKTSLTPEVDATKTPESPFATAESQQSEEAAKTHPVRPAGQRQSPFEDDFTLPETHATNISKRYTSSMSSDVSDYVKSPFEDAHFAGRIESVVEEPVCDSDSELKNGRGADDVFLPMDNAQEGAAKFLDGATIKSKPVAGGVGGSEDSRTDKPPSHVKTRLSHLRADSASSLRKSDSVNIFVRETDPFDDDFFSTSEASTAAGESGVSRRRDRAKAHSDTMKWTNTFDFFDFEEGQ